VLLFINNGDGTFQSPRLFGTAPTPYDVDIADLNGDGLPDVVATCFGFDAVSILLHQ